MKMISNVIKYFLIAIYYATLYYICYDTRGFYETNNPILTFLIVLFIYIYRSIVHELHLSKGHPGLPKNKLHIYFGTFIQEHYDFFARYVGAYQILPQIIKLDITKENGMQIIETNSLRKFLGVCYYIIFIIFNSLCYYWTILYFFIAHPTTGFIIDNFLKSLVDFTITNAKAMEDDFEQMIDTVEKKLNKNTIPHINPILVNLSIGIAISIIMKKDAYNLIKHTMYVKKLPHEMELYHTVIKSFALGSVASTFIATGQYYALVDSNFFNAIQYARYQDVISPVNEYIISENVKENKNFIINCVESSRNKRQLARISNIIMNLPDGSKDLLTEDYLEAIYKSKKTWKE